MTSDPNLAHVLRRTSGAPENCNRMIIFRANGNVATSAPGWIAAAWLALWMAAVGTIAAADVVVQPLTGERLEGQLKLLTADKLVLTSAGGERSLDLKDVQSLQFNSAATADKPRVWLELVDGSQLLGSAYQAANGQAKVELLGGIQVQILTRSIRSVRFREQEEALLEQWAAICKGDPTGDLLVIRKASTRTIEQPGQEPRQITETALDELDGTVLEVGPTTVKFEFGGDKIDVNREKVEGIVYFHPVKRELPAAACRVMDCGRSVWMARSVELKDGRLDLISTAGVPASLPLAHVWQIDFSSGNVKFLGELEEESTLTDASFQPRSMVATFKQLMAPRWVPVGRGRPFGGEGLMIGGRSYDSGLMLASRTRLAYRVPEGMRWFRADAGLDDTAGPAANLILVILADNREIYRQAFSADNARKAEPIVLDLGGAGRLSIVVEDGAGLDIADQLDLADARFTK